MPRGSRQLPDACVEILRAADLIVHTGDFVSLAAFEDLRGLGRVEAVHGNMDEPALREALPARIAVEHDGLRIGVVHSGGRAPDGRPGYVRGFRTATSSRTATRTSRRSCPSTVVGS